MVEKIFVDSDIFLDALLQRTPFAAAAAKVLDLGAAKSTAIYTSAVVFSNIFYILRKTIGFAEAKKNLQKLRLIVNILPIPDHVVDSALASNFSDFEDGLQYFTAKSSGITTLLTRNGRDYKITTATIQTADDYTRDRDSLSRNETVDDIAARILQRKEPR